MLDKRSVVILNDTTVPPGLAGGALKRYVERGGGLLVAFGDHSAWPTTRNRPAAGQTRIGRRSHRWTRRDDRLPRLQPSGVRSVQGAAQRRLLRRARPSLSRDRAGTSRSRASRGTTTAPWRRSRSASARAASSRGRRRSTTRGPTWRLKPVYLPLVHQFTRYLSQYEQTSVLVDGRTGRRSVGRATRRRPIASS